MEATIILLNGDNVDLPVWQKLYSLPVGSSHIGRFFYMGEKSFDDNLIISEGIIRLLDVIRAILGRPIFINDLDRTKEEQARLKSLGYRTAEFSPHVYKLAVDIDTVSKDDTYNMLEAIDEAAWLLGYTIRIGWEDYMKDGHTFVHVDICPMMYAPGKPWNKKSHPKVWENQIEW